MVQEVRGGVEVGFMLQISLQPAGVGIGKLPVGGKAKIEFVGNHDGFHSSPGSWQPTKQHPGPVTSDMTLNIAYSVDVERTMEALIQVGVGAGFSGNIEYPNEELEIKMRAYKEPEKYVLPWTP